jgi:hypothetical protein
MIRLSKGDVLRCQIERRLLTAQWATVLVIEQMQRWRCPGYDPRTTIIAPYSSTEVINAVPDTEKDTLLFFR